MDTARLVRATFRSRDAHVCNRSTRRRCGNSSPWRRKRMAVAFPPFDSSTFASQLLWLIYLRLPLLVHVEGDRSAHRRHSRNPSGPHRAGSRPRARVEDRSRRGDCRLRAGTGRRQIDGQRNRQQGARRGQGRRRNRASEGRERPFREACRSRGPYRRDPRHGNGRCRHHRRRNRRSDRQAADRRDRHQGGNHKALKAAGE